jgi:hypothetical protein
MRETDDMSDDSPYERVSNPERFAGLYAFADDLVAEFAERFVVAVETVAPECDDLTGGVLTAVRLAPGNGGAAVTITKTGFPGLFVRFGVDHTEAFPQCGCDACDEQLHQVGDELRKRLEAVAAGRFSEPSGGYEFLFLDGGRSGGMPSGPVAHAPLRTYEPWPPRVR